jgi:hypothetical protein
VAVDIICVTERWRVDLDARADIHSASGRSSLR